MNGGFATAALQSTLKQMPGRRHILVAAITALLLAPPLSAAAAQHGFANPRADYLMTRGLDATPHVSRVECVYIGGYVRRAGMECYGSFRGHETVWTFRPYRRGWMRVTVLGPGGQITRRMSCVRALRCY